MHIMTRHLSFRRTLGQLVAIESQLTKPINHYDKQPDQQRVTAFSEQFETETYPLELRHISPAWDSRISQKWPRLFSKMWFKWYFELKRTSKCVVGEAYGFSSSYIHGCKECDDIGWKFMMYFTINSRKKLDLNKERFVKHWNESHLPTIGITLRKESN
jgi:hypothetical protein